MGSLLSVRDLNVSFGSGKRRIDVLTGVNLDINHGEILAIVGESGSGKTTTAMMIMGLQKGNKDLKWSGSIALEGEELSKKSGRELAAIRGGRIGMIFQEPLTALHPAIPIGKQLDEVLRLHGCKDAKQRDDRVYEVLKDVGLSPTKETYMSLPSRLSGGMKQRVVIAMAVICRPSLVIADEPTTALDVTTQAQILSLLKHLKSQYGLAVMLITHDLGVVAEMADRVAVMYGGLILEEAPSKILFKSSRHPYTLGLMKCIPYVGVKQDRLYTIPGSVPHASKTIPGCIFRPRCPLQDEGCAEGSLPMQKISEGHCTRCMKWEEIV